MKKLIPFMASFFLLIAVVPSFAAEPRVVKVGAFSNFPVLFKGEDGTVQGLYVDILANIGTVENITFQYVFGTWTEGLERIKSGEIDLLTSVAYTEERSQFMDFCPTPLLTVWGELYALHTSEINGFQDVGGKTIAIMKGDINGKIFRESVSSFSINCQFIECTSFEDVFRAIASRAADAGVVGVTFGATKQMEYGLRSTSIVFNPLNLFFTVAKGKNSGLLGILDRHLADWKHSDDSPFSRARQKWLRGMVGTVPIIPEWLFNTILVLGFLILVSFAFIVILNIQVKKTTAEILQRETLLRDKNQQIRTIGNNIQNGMIYQIVMKKDGSRKFTYLSDSVRNLYGISPSEGMEDSNRIYSMVHEDDIDRLVREENLANQTLSQFKIEVRIREKSGGYRWSSIMSTPTEMANGSVQWDGIEIVITDRKRTEEEIHKLNANLERRVADRTAQLEATNKELEAFSYSVSHDLRAPLRHIDGFANLLMTEEGRDLSERARHYLEAIETSTRRMGILIDDLLQFSKTGRAELNLAEIDMNQSLAEALALVKAGLPEQEIEWKIGNLPPARADYALLRQVWANLLGNAVKYSRTKRNARIEIGGRKDNNGVIYTVSDNGVGFDMTHAEKLFGVFQRLHSSEDFEGNGIGLATVQRIINRHGGRIWAEAEEGIGATFHFTLPGAEATSAE